MTEQEIEEFKKLEDIQVVFDVGVRDSIDYLLLKPELEYHLFEPAPVLFETLKEKVKDFRKVYLNNCGLGDVEKLEPYNIYLQAFMDGVARPGWGGDINLPIKTLDWYIKEYDVKKIDFLKIDTEGYDLKVLQGGTEALKITKYLQFETWDNYEDFKTLLGDRWSYKDIGSRNIFCTKL